MLPIFIFQAVLCALVILEARSDVMTIDGRVCDYVIFDLDCPQLERSFWISWHKGNTSLQCWTRGKMGHGQRIRVFPNGTLGLHVAEKEDAGWYTAMMCNSSQHCLCQRKFQLRVHGHLVSRLVGDCVTFDLNCLQSAGHIQVIWKKDNQRVAKTRQAANASLIYCERVRVFPNGSLSRCPTQWGDEGEYVAEVFDQDGVHLRQETFNLELNKQKETFRRNPVHVLFFILIVSLGVVIIIILVALTWHFQKHKDRSDGERPGLKGTKVVKTPASVCEMCVAPNVENTTYPEFQHCSPPAFEDYLPPSFDHYIPPGFDGCAPAEFNYCSPPGSEGLKDASLQTFCDLGWVPSGSVESLKCEEGAA